MSLNEKCCNALGCRSEIEKELESLRKVVSMISGSLGCAAANRLMSRAFGEPKLEASVKVGDYYWDGFRVCYVRNQFAAECINDELDGVETVQVWRNENT